MAKPPLPAPSRAGVSPNAVAEPTPAGEGVAGTLLVVELNVCAGAAGGAGVEATAGAGVDGAFVAGGALGYKTSEADAKCKVSGTNL
jgi:hypothetical protein